MSAYLFVHFKEKRTPDGEQVYFAVSKDGFHWESVNDGNPVLWSYEGEKGVRDFTITRTQDNRFVILATDLSLSYEMSRKYQNSWDNVIRKGSKCLVMWESSDLIHWSDQKMLPLGDDSFGCLWAPDILFDKKTGEYLIHWTSTRSLDDYRTQSIYYSRTADFQSFSAPEILYARSDGDKVIDSAMYEEDGRYYCFVKLIDEPRHLSRVVLLASDHITGPFARVEAFDESTQDANGECYEAPTAFHTSDGRICLLLDFFGACAEEQGYRPYLADSFKSGRFLPSEESFSFPYGFKHGTVLEITDEEYERLKDYRKKPSER